MEGLTDVSHIYMHCPAQARFIRRKTKIGPLPERVSSAKWRARTEVMATEREVRMRKRDRPVMKGQGDSTTCRKRSNSVGGIWPVTWPRSGVLSFIADQQGGTKTLLNMLGRGEGGGRGGGRGEERMEVDEEKRGKEKERVGGRERGERKEVRGG